MSPEQEAKIVTAPEGIFVVQVMYIDGHDLNFNVPRDIPLWRFHELVEQCHEVKNMVIGRSIIRRIEFCDPICQQPNAGFDTRNIEIVEVETVELMGMQGAGRIRITYCIEGVLDDGPVPNLPAADPAGATGGSAAA